ncbi:MAG: hypothetical protein KAU58_04675, partial [Candidatus Omnitrophica bacterium]|nr:hypothetical protein [Candidatus Omnitrophota bacterium]
LHNISPNMVRDFFAEASYRALTELRRDEGGRGLFLRMADSDKNIAMLINAMETGAEIFASDELRAARRFQRMAARTPKHRVPISKTAKGSKQEFLGAIDGKAVVKYTIQLGDVFSSEPLVSGISHRLYVKEGEVVLRDEKGEEVKTIKAGEIVETDMANYELYTPTSSAVVYMEYKPQEAESTVIAGFEAISSPINKERFSQITAGDRKAVMLHVPSTMHVGNSFIMEKKTLRSMSKGTVYMTQYGRTIEELKKAQLNPNYEHVFVMYRDDLENVKKNKALANKLQHVLTQRIMPITRPKDEAKGVAFAREIEAAAVTLGLTDKEEIEHGTGNAVSLQRIMSQLVGKEVTFDLLKSLMDVTSYDFKQTTNRISILINKLLISKPINKYDMDSVVHARREVLWSL